MSTSLKSISHIQTHSSVLPLLDLVDTVRFFSQQGWTPATSSNFSCRAVNSPYSFWISSSGLDKGQITPADFLEVDFNAQVVDSSVQHHLKPSAETLLHALIYQQYPTAHAVVHTHSIHATVLSKLYEHTDGITLEGFEILKAFCDIKTHETAVFVPLFENSQDIPTLCKSIEGFLNHSIQPVYGFLLAGHGLYTWGETPADAKRHAEAFEFLFECILKLRSYGYSDYS